MSTRVRSWSPSAQQKQSSTCKPCPISVSLSSPHLSPDFPLAHSTLAPSLKLMRHSPISGPLHRLFPLPGVPVPECPPGLLPHLLQVFLTLSCPALHPFLSLPRTSALLCSFQNSSHALTKHNLLIVDLSRFLFVLYTRMSALPAADFRYTVDNNKCLLNE